MLKEKLKNSKFIGPLYSYLAQKKHQHEKKKAERYFAKHSTEVMSIIQKNISDSKRMFYFAFGTLLGVIRENDLLKHDLDVDLIVYCKDQEDISNFKKYLIDTGFELRYEFTVDGFGIIQNTFVVKKIGVDIHYCIIEECDHCDYVNVLFDEGNVKNKVARFACTHSKQPSVHSFKNIQINLPEDPIAFIENMYGANWRFPDKGYKYWKSACVTVLDKIGECVSYM